MRASAHRTHACLAHPVNGSNSENRSNAHTHFEPHTCSHMPTSCSDRHTRAWLTQYTAQTVTNAQMHTRTLGYTLAATCQAPARIWGIHLPGYVAASLMLEGLQHHVRVGGIAPLTHFPYPPGAVSKVVRTSKVMCVCVCARARVCVCMYAFTYAFM